MLKNPASGNHSAKGQVKEWLEFLGFELGRCDVERELQFSNTCGFISARVASMQGMAASWSNVDTAAATADEVWQSGYDDVLRMHRQPGAFRTDAEVQQLLAAWDTNTNRFDKVAVSSLDYTMTAVAKFVRALAYYRGIITDKDFPAAHGTDAERLISRVFSGDTTFPQRIISNTQTSSSSGFHWFNVAFSIDFDGARDD